MVILIILVIITILVLVHELGHFLLAKKFNIKVEEFGLGFPPRLIGKKIGETLYSINWFPIGGFVKLYGEDEAGGGRIKLKVKSEKLKVQDKKDLERAFFAKPWWQRGLVALAGVVMNFLLASLIFYITLSVNNFTFEVPLIFDHTFRFARQEKTLDIIIRSVAADSPAQSVGVKPNSRLLALDGQSFQQKSDVFKKYIDERRGKEVTMSFEELGTKNQYSVKVVPRENPPSGEGAIGIGFVDHASVRLIYETVPMKVFSGFSHAINMTEYNVKILGRLIGLSIEQKTAEPISSQVTGPIGIGFLVDAVLQIPNAKERMLTLLNMAALISLSLGIINIVPFPALDGGRLFFILIEGLTRRKINPVLEGHINRIGFIVLILLIVVIARQDLLRFVLVR